MKNIIIKNTVYLYLTTAIKLIGPLITLPYLTRVLSVDAYGFVAFVKSYASYVQLVLDFGFLLSATKSIAVLYHDEKDVGFLVGDTVIEKLLLAFVCAIATAVLCQAIPLLSESPMFTWLYFFSCVSTVLILDFLYRGIQRMEFAAIPLAISKILVVVLTLLMVKGDEDLLLIPALELAGNVAAGLISICFLRRLGIRPKCSGVKRWIIDLKESGIYFISNFATTVFGALTTLIVGAQMGKGDVAYWSICMTIVSAAKALYSPLSNSIYPNMVITKNIAIVHRLAKYGTALLAPLAVFILIYGEGVMGIIGGEKYAAAGGVLKMLLPVIVCSYYSMLYGWPALGALGNSASVTTTTVISAAVQIVLVMLFLAIGQLNLTNMAISCGIAEATLLVTRLALLKTVGGSKSVSC